MPANRDWKNPAALSPADAGKHQQRPPRSHRGRRRRSPENIQSGPSVLGWDFEGVDEDAAGQQQRVRALRPPVRRDRGFGGRCQTSMPPRSVPVLPIVVFLSTRRTQQADRSPVVPASHDQRTLSRHLEDSSTQVLALDVTPGLYSMSPSFPLRSHLVSLCGDSTKPPALSHPNGRKAEMRDAHNGGHRVNLGVWISPPPGPDSSSDSERAARP